MTFVDVFVNIFDCMNRSTNFHIDMAVVFCRQIRIVWKNISVVIPVAIFFKKAPIVRPSILWIAIITKMSGFTKFLWKLLCTSPIGHAFGIRMFSTTWSMYHILGNDLIENR